MNNSQCSYPMPILSHVEKAVNTYVFKAYVLGGELAVSRAVVDKLN